MTPNDNINTVSGQVPPTPPQVTATVAPEPQNPNPPFVPGVTSPDDGTKTLGILSIVFAFVFSIVGLILAIVGTNKAKQIKQQTGQDAQGAQLIKVGLICSIVMIVLPFILLILLFTVFASLGFNEYGYF
jgi:hypothetical protein